MKLFKKLFGKKTIGSFRKPEFIFNKENINSLIKKYTDLGIKREKIICSEQPYCIYSKTKKCLITDPPTEFIVKINNGKFEYYSKDYKDNIRIFCNNYTNITKEQIDTINNSNDGIIICGETYGEIVYRFGFVY